MELLAPAGTMENFMAALEAGADAIYLGGKVFNARSHAGNFDYDELREALCLAHILQVGIYVTVNILVGDRESKALAEHLRELERIGVDGIIVQDLGVARIARQVAPSLELHGSTQMTATNLETVQFLERLGFTRVVLSRELSLDEIRHICAQAKAEIEVFIHGAMCMAISGRCLLSNYFVNRDANRGICAQDCRWNYKVIAEGHEEKGAHDVVEEGEQTFIFNAKDLCTIEFIDQVLEAGVDSLKIEGRMKSIYYNSTVVKQYKRALDSYYSGNYQYDPKWLAELETISHRLYSKGFYLSKTTEADQNYATGLSYSQTYQLVANVIEKTGENKYKWQIRNRIFTDMEFELVRPEGDPMPFKLTGFYNVKKEEMVDVVHPNTIVEIETDLEMGPMDLIRIKLPEGQSDSDMDTMENTL